VDLKRAGNRELLDLADLVFAVDVTNRKQSLMFGRVALDGLVQTGQSNILGIFNVGLDQESTQITRLAALVNDVHGHHEYAGAGGAV
jgi:hypothetical protein